ncbi:unnamed protein product [Allacma fusca]|uniref:Uncharacterized protein n=1 Tax=Allacma fusca TaxID=39272 RepID=A0A8J2PIA6_9HEXA|nr:unnamed protein product [Allacma fusca]
MQQVQREFAGLTCWNGLQTADSACSGRCLYVFSSTPKPLPIFGRPKFRNNVPKPKDIGDFYNVMWDPRVRRGKPDQPEKNFIQCFNVRKPRTVIRKPRFVYERPPTPPRWRRDNYEGLVPSHMEELNPHLVEDENAIVDLESALELPTHPSGYVPPQGIDVETEILLGDLFDFDNLVIPVCEALVGQVIHRSLLELLEEEELESLRTQQAKFEDIRSTEQMKLLEMKEQHDRLEAERIAVMERAAEYRKTHEEATQRLQAVAFSSFYLGRPLNDVRDSLRRNNSFAELHNLIASIFNPWVNKHVQVEVEGQMLCRNLFDEIILATVQNRQAEFEFASWKREQEQIARMQLNAAREFSYQYNLIGEDE